MKNLSVLALLLMCSAYSAGAQEILPYDSTITVNGYPICGFMWDIPYEWEPETIEVERVSEHVGSMFDTYPNPGFRYIFNMTYRGISFSSNGERYRLDAVKMKGNNFSFIYNSQDHMIDENTTESEFKSIFPSSGPYHVDGETSYFLEGEYQTETWELKFINGKLDNIRFSVQRN